MHARVVTFQGSPGQVQGEDRERHFRERVLPTLQQQAGFKGAYVLLDRQHGKMLGITLWESDEAARAAMGAMEPIRNASAQAFGAPSVAPESYEVVYSS
jgi:heme-degrading monooxygenase HmoA